LSLTLKCSGILEIVSKDLYWKLKAGDIFGGGAVVRVEGII